MGSVRIAPQSCFHLRPIVEAVTTQKRSLSPRKYSIYRERGIRHGPGKLAARRAEWEHQNHRLGIVNPVLGYALR